MYWVTDLNISTLRIVSEDYGAANVTVTVEWTQLVDAVYNVKIMPSVAITRSMNSCKLTIPYNTEYSLSVEAATPCRPNTTALIRLNYGNFYEHNNNIIVTSTCII